MGAAAVPAADGVADGVDAARGEKPAIFAAFDGPAIGVGFAAHILVGAFMQKNIVLYGAGQAGQSLAVEPDSAARSRAQRAHDGQVSDFAPPAGDAFAGKTCGCGFGDTGLQGQTGTGENEQTEQADCKRSETGGAGRWKPGHNEI